MQMNFKVIDDKVLKKYKERLKVINPGTIKGIKKGIAKLDSELTNTLYSGKYGIKQRHGQAGLAGSFKARYFAVGDTYKAIYGSKLIYAYIQEVGGKIKVTPRMAGYAWHQYGQTGNKMWMAIALRKNRTIKIPAHYYLRGTWNKNRHAISNIIMMAIIQAVK